MALQKVRRIILNTLGKTKKILTGDFTKNVATITIGTSVAQAITLCLSPLITRQYGPESMGILGSYLATLNIVTPLCGLSFPYAIGLPEKDSEAESIARLSAIIAITTSLIVATSLFIVHQLGSSLLGANPLALIIFLPLGILFNTAVAIAEKWCLRKKKFGLKARVSITNALWTNLAKIGFGLCSTSGISLILVTTIGSALNALSLRKGYFESKSNSAIPHTASPSLKETANKYRDFAIFRTPQNLLNAASQGLPILLLANYSGAATAGYYALCKSALAVPTNLIGQSIASVFYQRIGDSQHKSEKKFPIILKTTIAMAMIGIIPFTTIAIFGEHIFVFIFGSEWKIAGIFAQWITVWSFFGFINRPSVAAIPVLNLQKYFLGYEIISTVARAITLIAAFSVSQQPVTTVACFSVVSAALNAKLIFVVLRQAYRCDK